MSVTESAGLLLVQRVADCPSSPFSKNDRGQVAGVIEDLVKLLDDSRRCHKVPRGRESDNGQRAIVDVAAVLQRRPVRHRRIGEVERVGSGNDKAEGQGGESPIGRQRGANLRGAFHRIVVHHMHGRRARDKADGSTRSERGSRPGQ